eukprot:COSAG06_NODE_66720_length_253_cov_1.584416_1_plen_35_part_01
MHTDSFRDLDRERAAISRQAEEMRRRLASLEADAG